MRPTLYRLSHRSLINVVENSNISTSFGCEILRTDWFDLVRWLLQPTPRRLRPTVLASTPLCMVVDILGFFRGRRKLQQDLPEEPVAATSVPSLPPRPQPPAAVISPLAPRRLDPAPHAKVPASATSSSAASSSDDSDKELEATTETGTMSKLDALLRDYGLDPYGDMLKDLGYNTPRKARRITHGGKKERERVRGHEAAPPVQGCAVGLARARSAAHAS